MAGDRSASKQLLPREDGEVAEILSRQLQKDGVKIYFEYTASHFESSKTVVIQNAEGAKETIEFDAVFSAIGRDIDIHNLDVEKAGIALTQDGRRLISDEYFRTTNPNVILCGDALGQAQFTHEAERHAGIILNNFFLRSKRSWTIRRLLGVRLPTRKSPPSDKVHKILWLPG